MSSVDFVDWLDESFFECEPQRCAKSLIGCTLHWHGCSGRIVETEAYDANGDPACHTDFRVSARDFVQSHDAGVAYVYLNYGVHWLFNVLVKGGGRSGFVLIRAIEPIDGLEQMRSRRAGVKDQMLGAGPGRLTRALGIDGTAHGLGFMRIQGCGIRMGRATSICEGPRIGISRAKDFPWRFGDPTSRSLSRPFD